MRRGLKHNVRRAVACWRCNRGTVKCHGVACSKCRRILLAEYEAQLAANGGRLLYVDDPTPVPETLD